MTAQVTVGLDGSDESLAAARWAATQAVLREVPLRLVHVEEWPNAPEVPLAYARTLDERTERLMRDETERARKSHPDLEVVTEHARGRAAEELTTAANEADLTVLGSRGLGGVRGFLVGSVSLAVVGAARQPVVLVRAKDNRAGPGDGIVVGVDIYHPCEALLAFSFSEAARKGTPLRFLHSWTLPASYGYAAIMDPGIGEELGSHLLGGLDNLLEPWRKRYAGVEVEAKPVVGSPAYQLVEASQTAQLVIVGRRSRNVPLGPHLGHVAHAVIHHSPAPVAVVPLT
ncbi:UspA domain-containing protein [Streptomyces venezuelae]|uniref:universal stress protein n=1 Tax=Streptomyces gardneri TaxID=66892 RepID=UPI0006BCDE5D|nr:universal stress protein [Streptomyces gardneri]ALO12497.1 UspA domain-containing protein [Streptomyces venezuelae]QPK49260.1 universal stress protein [Streptomyces gardneri]WRK40775.1 universal stress protein [Streptomyces venezuelae]CUM36875.1 Universal stress protein family [Streptomyces venezuelae]